MTKELVELTAKLYRCQSSCKRFYGNEYADKIAPYQQLLTGYAKENKIDALEAAIRICKDDAISNSGWTVMLILAAAVELIEPSA